MRASFADPAVIAGHPSWFERTSRSAFRTGRDRARETSGRPHPLPGFVHVGRDAVPSSWRQKLLAPFELLALAWSIPLAVLGVAVPLALLVSFVAWLAAYLLRQL